VEQKEHASFLQPAIKEILAEAGIQAKDLSAVAVTTGPGSYTGLRVGLASAKGICFALDIPLITIGTLDVMAAAAKEWMQHQQPELVHYFICPLIDARRNEVFTAIFNENLETLEPAHPLVLDEHSFEQLLQQQPVLFFGTGAAKWKTQCVHAHALFENIPWSATSMVPIALRLFKANRFASLAYATPLYGKEFYTAAAIKKS
jgi:tRNA threonylcarbamoyladenosine biosynthesis protein TsaB